MARAVAAPLLVALACVTAVAGCTRSPSAEPAPDVAGRGVVVNVVDGDTLEVDIGGRVERVRLVGIDTPESVDPDRPVECHGPEASALLGELLPTGTEVRLERDEEARDRYGRLLGYVFRTADGLFVNQAIAAAGEAEPLDIPPNTAYRDVIADAVAQARADGLGLWGACPAH
ncbi:MAG: thermonuclease family protein [Acidimicrobiales bacterium]